MEPGSYAYESFHTLQKYGYPIERLQGEALGKKFPKWNSNGIVYTDSYFNTKGGWAESGRVLGKRMEEAKSYVDELSKAITTYTTLTAQRAKYLLLAIKQEEEKKRAACVTAKQEYERMIQSKKQGTMLYNKLAKDIAAETDRIATSQLKIDKATLALEKLSHVVVDANALGREKVKTLDVEIINTHTTLEALKTRRTILNQSGQNKEILEKIKSIQVSVDCWGAQTQALSDVVANSKVSSEELGIDYLLAKQEQLFEYMQVVTNRV